MMKKSLGVVLLLVFTIMSTPVLAKRHHSPLAQASYEVPDHWESLKRGTWHTFGDNKRGFEAYLTSAKTKDIPKALEILSKMKADHGITDIKLKKLKKLKTQRGVEYLGAPGVAQSKLGEVNLYYTLISTGPDEGFVVMWFVVPGGDLNAAQLASKTFLDSVLPHKKR